MCEFDEAYFLSVRMIELDGGDQILASTPAIHAGFATDADTADNMNPGGGIVPIFFQKSNGTSCNKPGVPGFVPLATLPPLDSGVPQIPAMVGGPLCPSCPVN